MFKRSSSTIRRAALALGLAIATTAAGAAVAPVTASAAPASFTKPILTITTPWQLALDVSGASTSNGAPVILWWGNGNANQQWTFEQTGQVTSNGVIIYRIRNVNSGKMPDHQRDRRESADPVHLRSRQSLPAMVNKARPDLRVQVIQDRQPGLRPLCRRARQQLQPWRQGGCLVRQRRLQPDLHLMRGR